MASLATAIDRLRHDNRSHLSFHPPVKQLVPPPEARAPSIDAGCAAVEVVVLWISCFASCVSAAGGALRKQALAARRTAFRY